MKNIYCVVCWKIPNATDGKPEKDAGNLYFSIEKFKTGCNLKAEIDAMRCEYVHLCESKKEAEDLRAFWTECEKVNRKDRDLIKFTENTKERKFKIEKVDDPSKKYFVETKGSAYDVALYVLKNDLKSEEYFSPVALAFNEGYKCTFAMIDHIKDAYNRIYIQEVIE